MPLFLPVQSSNRLQPLNLFVYGLTKRLLIRVNRIKKPNVQTQHVGQIVYAFMSAVVHLNLVKSFRNPGIDLLLDEDHIFCTVIPGLA
jgi:hypothetical protein